MPAGAGAARRPTARRRPPPCSRLACVEILLLAMCVLSRIVCRCGIARTLRQADRLRSMRRHVGSRHVPTRNRVRHRPARPSGSTDARTPSHASRSSPRDAARRLGSVEELEELLPAPTPALVDEMAQVDGDIAGPRRRRQDGADAGPPGENAPRPASASIGVARFSDAGVRERGSKPAASRRSPATCSTAPPSRRLPDAPNVVFTAGQKFGVDRQHAADLGDETCTCRPSSPRRFRAVAHRRLLDRQRLSADAPSAGPGADRGAAGWARSASTRSPASAGSGCSSTSRPATARRAASSASTTPSTCATAC